MQDFQATSEREWTLFPIGWHLVQLTINDGNLADKWFDGVAEECPKRVYMARTGSASRWVDI